MTSQVLRLLILGVILNSTQLVVLLLYGHKSTKPILCPRVNRAKEGVTSRIQEVDVNILAFHGAFHPQGSSIADIEVK